MSNELRIEGKKALVAFGTVKVAAGVITAATTNTVNSTVTRTGAGGFLVFPTPGNFFTEANTYVKISNRQGPGLEASAGAVSAGNFAVSTLDGTGTPADRNFDYEVWQLLPG